MGKKNDSITLRIDYAYTPYVHLISPDMGRRYDEPWGG